MDIAFASAVPEPTTILGLRLLPLSLGRYRLLKRFGCSFVAEGFATASMDDLFLGLVICSLACGEFLELIESPHAGRELKRWGKRIRKEIRRDKHFTIFEKYALFRRYIAEASATPSYWVERDNDGAPGSAAHWSTAVEVVLRGELGYSKEEIEEGPLSKALLDYFKWSENTGAIRLLHPGELDAADENARILEAAFAKAKAAGETGNAS